jgi:hypothetical protein
MPDGRRIAIAEFGYEVVPADQLAATDGYAQIAAMESALLNVFDDFARLSAARLTPDN